MTTGYELIALVTFDVDLGAKMRDKPITTDWGATILVDDVLYPGRVVACDKPIFFGETGQLILSVFSLSGYLIFAVDQEFGLCTGSQRIASGRVLEIL